MRTSNATEELATGFSLVDLFGASCGVLVALFAFHNYTYFFLPVSLSLLLLLLLFFIFTM